MKYIIAQPNRSAGIGHQFHNWVVGLIAGKQLGCEVLHTPINSGIRNKPSQNYLSWNTFLNFNKNLKKQSDVVIKNFVNLPAVDFGHVLYKTDEEIDEIFLKWKTIVENSSNDSLFIIPYDQYVGCLSKRIQHDNKLLLQELFWENKIKSTDDKTIGIHIRRGDINPHTNQNRWRSLDFYQNIIDFLNTEYKNHKILVFSEGDTSNFISLLQDNVELRLNTNDFDCFLDLCSVDVLVTGASSFSILAAYLNKGVVYYDKLLNFTMWSGIKNFYNIEDYIQVR